MSGVVLVVASAMFAVGLALTWLPDTKTPELAFAAKAMLLLGVIGWLGAWTLRRQRGPRQADLFFAKLSALGVALLLALGLGEFAVRIIYRDVTTTGDFTSYFSRRWKQGVRLNDLGFRERAFDLEVEPGTFRIAVIGDSLTYGPGLEDDERFSNRLEASLNAGTQLGTGYQVLNFGQPGAATEDELKILRDHVLPLRPDFVLLQWYRNDVEGSALLGRPQPMRLIPSDYLTAVLHEHSALYYLLSMNWNRLQGALGWSGDYDAYMRERFADPEGADSQEARRHLTRFVALCRGGGIPLGIVTFPVMWGNDEFTYLRERVLAFCREESLPCLDLAPAFGRPEDRQKLWVNPFDSHPGVEANRIAARQIEQRFGRLWRTAARTKP